MCDFIEPLRITAKLMRKYLMQVTTSKFHQNTFAIFEMGMWAHAHIQYTEGWTDGQAGPYFHLNGHKTEFLLMYINVNFFSVGTAIFVLPLTVTFKLQRVSTCVSHHRVIGNNA
jgi:hypothetical protein